MLLVARKIKHMIGSGLISRPGRQHFIQQTCVGADGMSGRRLMLVLIAGMMKDEANLITFSGKEGLVGAVHQHGSKSETLSASNPEQQINRQGPEDHSK